MCKGIEGLTQGDLSPREQRGSFRDEEEDLSKALK